MSNRLLVGTKKGLFTLRRSAGAAPWRIAGLDFEGQRVTMMLHDKRDGALYAAIDGGHFGQKLHKSENKGKTWAEATTPAYPKSKKPDAPALNLIWSMEAAGDDMPGVIYAGTQPGGLFRSKDGAKSWRLVKPLWDAPQRVHWMGGGADKPGIHSICIDPRDSKKMMVGVSVGGVYITEDGGKTWVNKSKGVWAAYMPPEMKELPGAQDPHRIVQSRGKPGSFWMQHHNGIFHTTNGGESWKDIKKATPSVFGFAVAVHPRDGKTAWFVPAVKDEMRVPVDAKVVVSRTRDGGKSFQVLKKGLPQKNAYDLVYRHCLDIDETGDSLAFGSTTGSLWTTDDQGDSWATISEHLPPVFAVRFA
jgi:photosystem II stability/assembly factor-like uncharacterized protein